MTPEGIPPAQLPNEWIQIVVRLLREGPGSSVTITQRARLDWENTFPEATGYDLYTAMANALLWDRAGNRVEGMRPLDGETYEFWFYYASCRLYGKINLFPSRDRILIYSSHLPLKGDNL